MFVDTPGIFAKAPDKQSKRISREAEETMSTDDIDVLLYLVDYTRARGPEENKVLGIARKIQGVAKILVANKIDIRDQKYKEEYRFLEDEFDEKVEISALQAKNIPFLLDTIFKYLKEADSGEKFAEKADLAFPALNISSKMYIEEIIREKCFLELRDEVPYQVQIVADDILEKDNGVIYIKARVLTQAHYKKMIIGKNASRIKEIGMMARKELEQATGKRIYLDLTVEAS